MVLVYIRNLFRRLVVNKMDSDLHVLSPPTSVQGMKVLDRNAFQREVVLPALLVPLKSLKNFRKMMKSKLANLTINKKVIDPPTNLVGEGRSRGHKLFLLKPGTTMDLDEEKRSLQELGIENKIYDYKLTLSYENYKHWDILRAILPDGEMAARGFSQVGHILHVNLRDHQLPYKQIIGQVLLDKIPTAKTVVNKHQNIDNEFRNFQMEVIAGDNNLVTRIIEHGRKFEFDFSKVFWNSRLSTEHQRITHLIPRDATVFDVFAGVGPFAIPIAKKGCLVYANDLNPDSYKWLVHNVKLNKTEVECFNCDGRDFIRDNLRNYILTSKTFHQVHVVMNLPAIAVEFLDVFPGLLYPRNVISSQNESDEQIDMPDVEVVVHLYIFAPEKDGLDDLKSRILKNLGFPLPKEAVIFDVRNVAPKKQMFCVSFQLTKEILFYDANEVKTETNEPSAKKFKKSES
uniref:tRNA (guanine(37)-N1)-methyltransferase n=1 Tax=Ciona savignyi TaxID=51511 RepID=H2Y5Z4_CIOSA